MEKNMSKNKAADRFCKGLFSAFGKWKTPDEVKETYTEKIGKWFLTDDQWARSLSRLVADFEDLPPLSKIFEYLKASRATGSEATDKICLTFRLEGRPYVLARDSGNRHPNTGKTMLAVLDVNPASPPRLPDGAEDVHLSIPPGRQAEYEPCGPEEGKKAFAAGFMQVCHDGAVCQRMMRDLYPKEIHDTRAEKALVCL